MHKMRRIISILMISLSITISPISSVSAGNTLDDIARIMPSMATPYSSLFFALALAYTNSETMERINVLKGSIGNTSTDKAEQLNLGNQEIQKIKALLTKPAAINQLKILTLFWQAQMNEVSSSHTNDHQSAVIRELKNSVDRIKLEVEW